MAVQILPKRSNTALAIPQASDLIAGELAMNVADGKFYTKTTGGAVKEMGSDGLGWPGSFLGPRPPDTIVLGELRDLGLLGF